MDELELLSRVWPRAAPPAGARAAASAALGERIARERMGARRRRAARRPRRALLLGAALTLAGAGAAIGVQAAMRGGVPAPAHQVTVRSLDGTTTRDLELLDGVGASVDLAQLRLAAEVEGRAYLVGPGRAPDTVCTVSVEPEAQVVGCDSTAAYRDRRGTLLMYQRDDGTRSGVLILPPGVDEATVVVGGRPYRSTNRTVVFDLPAAATTLRIDGGGQSWVKEVPAAQHPADPEFLRRVRERRGG